MTTGTFTLRTPMPISAQALHDWHARPGAFERLNLPWDPVTLEERSGGLEVGARTVLRMRVGPATMRWVAVHTAHEPGLSFRDEQESGPFARWVHTHRFEPQPDGTSVLEDTVEYALPMGALGSAFGSGFTQNTLARMFRYRHALTRADLARHAVWGDRPPLTVAVAGSSGLVGGSLLPFLTTGGHTVRPVRRKGADLDLSALEGADVVVNLAGASLGEGRWTPARKRELVESRVRTTRALVEGMRRAPPRVLVQASAIGVYGDRGDEELDERSPVGARAESGPGFLAGLCLDWEAAAREAEALGVRVVQLRIGLVQTAQGGALKELLAPFSAGVGGPLADGRAWQSWVSLDDLLGMILHAAHDEGLAGPVNATGPAPVTGREYAATLGRVLGRPAVLPVPAFALRALLGEFADAAALASARVLPHALEARGFRFEHPTLEAALRHTLGR